MHLLQYPVSFYLLACLEIYCPGNLFIICLLDKAKHHTINLGSKYIKAGRSIIKYLIHIAPTMIYSRQYQLC